MQNIKTTAGGSLAGVGTAALAIEAFQNGQYLVGTAYAAIAVGSLLLGIFAKDK